MDIADCFEVPLRDLGYLDEKLAGILVPEPEIGREKVGVTRQFLEDASGYHARYSSSPYFRALIAAALDELGERPGGRPVLDLGSGSGNSVLPCLELLPDCRIVAVDISPQLLCILRAQLAREAGGERVTPVCMSATCDYYSEGCFGLAIGAAVLHHLLDPGAALAAVGRALAPGAAAIFFEPFENGNAILRLAYGDILERAEALGRASAGGFDVLRSLVRDHDVRVSSDKSDPIFLNMDDKWLFTRSILEELAERAGFSALEISPLHDVEESFSQQTQVNLRLAAGLEPSALPDWAWQRLAHYDGLFSAELKRDLLIEGRVILRK